jgi:hypothetical protein
MATVRRHPDHDHRDPSDTVLTSHGSADPGRVLAWDGDRGSPTNARILGQLQPAEYWLSVRHKTATRLVPTLWASLPGADDLLAIRSLTDWSGR